MKRVLCALGWFVLATAANGSEVDRCIRQTRFWGGDGPAEQLVVVNGHAFFGGWTLRVADVADPADPRVVNELRLDEFPLDLETHGDRVYLVDGTNQLTVIDATVPGTARIVTRFVPLDPFWMLDLMDVHGDLGVVAGRGQWSPPGATTTKLTLIDLSGSAAEPATIGSIEIDDVVESLALADGVAVAATRSNRLWFIDVGDPTAPVVATNVALTHLVTSGEVSDLAARDDLLAIGDTTGKVTLVDLSSPENPRVRGLVQGLGIGVPTVEFDGRMLHAVGSTCLPSGVCGGYALIDAAASGAPTLVGRVDGPKLTRPAPTAGFVVAAAFLAGMRVVDLRSMTAPVVLDTMLPAREAGAFASAGPLVDVVDVTTFQPPTDPDRNVLRILRRGPDGALTEVSSFHPEGAIWAVVGGDDYAAAAIYDEATNFHSVQVLDVSDPTMPAIGTRLGANVSLNHDTGEPHLKGFNNRMVLSLEGSDEILIYRVTDGRTTQLGDYLPGAELVDFAVASAGLLAVAVRQGTTGWIELVDTTDPSAPVMASSFALPAPADVPVGIDGEAGRVVVHCRDFDSWLGPYNYSILVDAADPTSPSLAIDRLPGGRWVRFGAGILHTVDENHVPPLDQHHAVDLTSPPDQIEIENLGRLDVFGDRVDADGRYFTVSRSRIEVHDYGRCEPIPAVLSYDAVPD